MDTHRNGSIMVVDELFWKWVWEEAVTPGYVIRYGMIEKFGDEIGKSTKTQWLVIMKIHTNYEKR